MKKFLVPTLLLGGVLGFAQFARTQTVSDTIALTEYRAALDQLGAGRPQNARVLLQSSLQRGEIAPESAVLLAYLEEKAGDSTRARQTLEGVSSPTNFVAAYLSRFGASQPYEIATQRPSANRAGATLQTNDARVLRLEKLMLQIVNNERASKGIAPLAWDETMASVARAHSAEMRERKYFAHESPTPSLKDPLDRYIAGVGKTPRLVAENVFRAWGSRSFLSDGDIRDAHKSLMDSPGHRSNILLDGATKIGIGIAVNATGDIWITQLYARPR